MARSSGLGSDGGVENRGAGGGIAAAAVLGEKAHQIVHRAVIGRVDQRSALTPLVDQSCVVQIG